MRLLYPELVEERWTAVKRIINLQTICSWYPFMNSTQDKIAARTAIPFMWILKESLVNTLESGSN